MLFRAFSAYNHHGKCRDNDERRDHHGRIGSVHTLPSPLSVNVSFPDIPAAACDILSDSSTFLYGAYSPFFMQHNHVYSYGIFTFTHAAFSRLLMRHFRAYSCGIFALTHAAFSRFFTRHISEGIRSISHVCSRSRSTCGRPRHCPYKSPYRH